MKRRIGNMNRHLDDAYSSGILVTTRYSFPITDRNRMLAYYAQMDEYARCVGMPELGPGEHDRRMAARKKGPDMQPRTNGTPVLDAGTFPKGYVPLTMHGTNGFPRRH